MFLWLICRETKEVQDHYQGLPWWLSGKESACQCRRHVIDPWTGKIPHATEQLSPCTATAEPVLWSLGATAAEALEPKARAAQQEKPLQWEAQAPQEE